MKKVMIVLSLILSSGAQAAPQKTVYINEILLKNLIKHQGHLHLDEKRMVAGEFEVRKLAPVKKTYLDNLRFKLAGQKGLQYGLR